MYKVYIAIGSVILAAVGIGVGVVANNNKKKKRENKKTDDELATVIEMNPGSEVGNEEE